MSRLTEEELNKYLTEAHPLNKQVPELVSTYQELVEKFHETEKTLFILQEENAQLKAENERYRKALGMVVSIVYGEVKHINNHARILHIVEIAQQALKGVIE